MSKRNLNNKCILFYLFWRGENINRCLIDYAYTHKCVDKWSTNLWMNKCCTNFTFYKSTSNVCSNMHIFNYSLELIFSCKWHLQLKWLVVALDKLHKTLIANDDVMMVSSRRQWMEYVFKFIIFSFCWLYNTCNYHATSDQFNNDQCHVAMWHIQWILDKSNLLPKLLSQPFFLKVFYSYMWTNILCHVATYIIFETFQINIGG
jgi:hypothetical protein